LTRQIAGEDFPKRICVRGRNMVIDIQARIQAEQPRNCGSIPGRWKTYNFSPNYSD